MINIFVYGTLKKGCASHHLIKDYEFVNAGWVSNTALISLRAFPGMIFGSFSKKYWAKGEIYKVPNETIAQLDKLESEGKLFKRIILNVDTKFGSHLCWTYILLMPLETRNLIPNGEWHD